MVTWLLVAAVLIFVPFAFVRWKREFGGFHGNGESGRFYGND